MQRHAVAMTIGYQRSLVKTNAQAWQRASNGKPAQTGKVQHLREELGQAADRFLLVAVRLWPFNCPSD